MNSNREKLVVILIGLGIVVLGFKIKQGWRLKQKLKLQQQKLSALEQTVAYRKKQVAKFDFNLKSSQQTQSQVLTSLDQITNQLDLELINLAPRANRRHDEAVEWPIAIKVAGKYQKLVNFLEQLNQLDWIIEVKTMELTAKQSKVTADLNLSVYTVAESRR